jgi:Tfp pilus assembly protein PilX
LACSSGAAAGEGALGYLTPAAAVGFVLCPSAGLRDGVQITVPPNGLADVTRPQESGFSLITILMMVVVLLVSLALAGMNSSLVQERMAGNARDRNIALQSAEAALRDAEADIEANLTVASAFVSACTGGLCLPPSMTSNSPTSQPLWKTVDWGTTAGKSRAYGSVTGATALPGVSAPPRRPSASACAPPACAPPPS